MGGGVWSVETLKWAEGALEFKMLCDELRLVSPHRGEGINLSRLGLLYMDYYISLFLVGHNILPRVYNPRVT